MDGFWDVFINVVVPLGGVILGAIGGVVFTHWAQRARPVVHVDRISVTSKHGDEVFDEGMSAGLEESLERFYVELKKPKDGTLLTERSYAKYLEELLQDLVTWHDQQLPRLSLIIARCIGLISVAKDVEFRRYMSPARVQQVSESLRQLNFEGDGSYVGRDRDGPAPADVIDSLMRLAQGTDPDGAPTRDERLQHANRLELELTAKRELALKLVELVRTETEKYSRLLVDGVVSNLGRTPVSLSNDATLIVNLLHAGKVQSTAEVALRIGASSIGTRSSRESSFDIPVVVAPGASLNVQGVSKSRMDRDRHGARLLQAVGAGSSPARLRLQAIGSRSKRFQPVESRSVSFGETVQRATGEDDDRAAALAGGWSGRAFRRTRRMA